MKIVISVAPVGDFELPGVSNPRSPEEIVRDVAACHAAGASMVHLHARNRSGEQAPDLSVFEETVAQIQSACDIVIQGSTGGHPDAPFKDRCIALECDAIETATLNLGSANLGNTVYLNPLPEVRLYAQSMREHGVSPECEVFDTGMLETIAKLQAEGLLDDRPVVNICMGFDGPLPGSARSLAAILPLLPPKSPWGLLHHGMPDQRLLVAATIHGAAMVRVGFEDSMWIRPGHATDTNADLVRALAGTLRSLGFEIATPDDARNLFQCRRKPA